MTMLKEGLDISTISKYTKLEKNLLKIVKKILKSNREINRITKKA